MEKIYSIVRIITYPAVFVRRMAEFLLCVILKIEPPEDIGELPYEEVVGHNPHGEFLFPLKAAAFNIFVFLLQAKQYGWYFIVLNAEHFSRFRINTFR